MTVPLAYLIVLHKNPEQFKRLFVNIYDPQHVYLVHIDQKAGRATAENVAAFLAAYPNAHRLKSRRCSWGGWSLVEMQLAGIRQLLTLDERWTHLILLSGQDFPLKTQAQISQQLATTPSHSFMQLIHPLPAFKMGWLNVIYVDLFNRVMRTRIRRKLMPGVAFYGGSNWMTLSRAACRYLVETPGLDAYKRFFRYAYTPEESFFQTVFMNSPLRETVVPDYQRYIIWDKVSFPKVFTREDLPALLNSEALFARKFDETVDSGVLEALEIALQTSKEESQPHA